MSRARKIYPSDDLPRDEAGRRQWQAFLTSDEREEQEKLARRAREIDRERREITMRLHQMRDRCFTRRRYFEQNPAGAQAA